MKIMLGTLAILTAIFLPQFSRAADAPTPGPAPAMSDAERHFLGQVKPLLDSRCITCHGPDKVKAGLRLDSRAALLKGGESGPSIVPGKPAESLLISSIKHTHDDLKMPPKEKLLPGDIEQFERWITAGAPWPDAKIAAAHAPKVAPGERLGDAWTDARNPVVQVFAGQRLDLWSLKPIQRIEPPKTPAATAQWARNDLDRLVLARRAADGAPLPAQADARTLIRRLTFDLHGLPPRPEDVAAFEQAARRDGMDKAAAKLIDDLLASPRFGEHFARMWLDVVRYSESNGFDWDEFRPQAWRYRDYVIRSFTADKPYDQFIREQLAGDELLAAAPRDAREQDALLATGFLRMGPWDNAAKLFDEQDRARAEMLADLTETTGSAFLGLTFSCCRCHDHKYDPLTQADHYRLRAFFEPVRFADDLPLDLASDQRAIEAGNAKIAAQSKALAAERDAITNPVKDRLIQANRAKLKPEERALFEIEKNKRTPAQQKQVESLVKKTAPDKAAIEKALSPDEKKRFDALNQRIAESDKQKRSLTYGLLMRDETKNIPATQVYFQGDHKEKRETVVPGFISALDPNPAAIIKPPNPASSGRRLALANWIASPRNPLTARVMVNRLWQNLMGQPLVATPNDFGLAGAAPEDAALLDWLADQFIRQGWSVKQFVRLVAGSATYQQAASSGSIAFATRKTRRISAEQLRDSLLAVSGLLNAKTSGPPVWPDLPRDVLEANPAFLDDNGEKTKGWYPSPKPEQYARSIFLVQKRNTRVPFLEIFDQPDNTTPCARREVSTVAPQALTLLNSLLATEAAHALAKRIQRDAGTDPAAQITRAYALALQRTPSEKELAACARLLKDRSLPELCRVLLNVNEFVYVD